MAATNHARMLFHGTWFRSQQHRQEQRHWGSGAAAPWPQQGGSTGFRGRVPWSHRQSPAAGSSSDGRWVGRVGPGTLVQHASAVAQLKKLRPGQQVSPKDKQPLEQTMQVVAGFLTHLHADLHN